MAWLYAPSCRKMGKPLQYKNTTFFGYVKTGKYFRQIARNGKGIFVHLEENFTIDTKTEIIFISTVDIGVKKMYDGTVNRTKCEKAMAFSSSHGKRMLFWLSRLTAVSIQE